MMIAVVILWSLAALTVIGLAVYRKVAVASREDDLIHVGAEDDKLIPQQLKIAGKLEAIDKWGKILTVLTVLVGLAIACVYLYQAWIASQTLGQ